MKIKVQAQHLRPGDIVGSGEKVEAVCISSTHWPSSKVQILLIKNEIKRFAYWGKYTEITVERADE
jgi:hypothetical protein